MKKVLISLILSFSMIFSNTAVLVSATTDNPYNTNGIILDFDPPGVVTHIDKKLEDILSSYEDGTYSFKDNEDITFVITKEGDLDIFRENSPYTLVTMKNGKKPPVEEINKKIGSEDKYNVVFYNKPYSDGYKCLISGKEYKDTVYNILKDDENVESIEECYDITLERGNISFFLLDSDVDINELISEFPKLGLEELGEYPEYMKEIYPDYSHIIGIRNIENPDYYKELYSVFTNLKDEEINYYPILGILESDDNSIYASSKNIIYQAEKRSSDNLLGDINADGKVDISDLTELSLAIIEDKTLTESQIKAADIDENGKADLPDLARLRQYLSKVIDSLRPGKTESKPVDAEELMLGYYNTTNENQFSDVQSSTRIGIKCKPFCSNTETLKVDVAIADLFTDYNADETTTHYIFDVYPTKDGYWREVEDNNFIVNDGTKISREYSKEEWNLFARNSYESDYDSYYHESAEIDFKNYEAGSEGVIRFIFYVKYDENPSNVQTSGDAQYLYYYVGKNGVGLGNSAENAKNEYFSRFEDELKEGKYTLTISDPSGCLAEAINTVYAPGETIELKFNPMTKSYFKVNFNKTEEVSFNGSTYSFVMPESDVEVSIELVEDKI